MLTTESFFYLSLRPRARSIDEKTQKRHKIRDYSMLETRVPMKRKGVPGCGVFRFVPVVTRKLCFLDLPLLDRVNGKKAHVLSYL